MLLRDFTENLWTVLNVIIFIVFFNLPINLHANTPPVVSYNLKEIDDRESLVLLLRNQCDTRQPQRLVVYLMFTPPPKLIADDSYRCGDDKHIPFNSYRPPVKFPSNLFSQTETEWLIELYRLMQEGTFTYMSKWVSPRNPQEISFLHRSFARFPYVTARLMASAPAPHVGEVWRSLAGNMDRILLASTSLEDHRLLAFAMIRDNRQQDALSIINDLLLDGDSLSLNLLPYMTLDKPVFADDDKLDEEELDVEMADTSEPKMSYQVLSILENYLYKQGYPKAFCQWADGLSPSDLKSVMKNLLINNKENLIC